MMLYISKKGKETMHIALNSLTKNIVQSFTVRYILSWRTFLGQRLSGSEYQANGSSYYFLGSNVSAHLMTIFLWFGRRKRYQIQWKIQWKITNCCGLSRLLI